MAPPSTVDASDDTTAASISPPTSLPLASPLPTAAASTTTDVTELNFFKHPSWGSKIKILAANQYTLLYTVESSTSYAKKTIRSWTGDPIATITPHSFGRKTDIRFIPSKDADEDVQPIIEFEKKGLRGKKHDFTAPSTGRDYVWELHDYTRMVVECKDVERNVVGLIDLGEVASQTHQITWSGRLAGGQAQKEREEVMIFGVAVYAAWGRAMGYGRDSGVGGGVLGVAGVAGGVGVAGGGGGGV